jgi:hypothetical protein
MPKSGKTAKRNKSQARQPQRTAQGTGAPTALKTGKPLYQAREMSRSTQIISLVVGDILCFVIFATLGTNAHGQGIDLLNSCWVALPFIAAWFIVSPWLGSFNADFTKRPKAMLIRTLLCWLATWPVAMALRWLLVDRVTGVTVGQFLSFSVVALLVNALLLAVVWRWLFALNSKVRTQNLS